MIIMINWQIVIKYESLSTHMKTNLKSRIIYIGIDMRSMYTNGPDYDLVQVVNVNFFHSFGISK